MSDNNDISNRQKAFLSASSSTNAAASGQMLDANSLQMAYLAVQLRGMQQMPMSHTSSKLSEPAAFVAASSTTPSASSSAFASMYNEAALQQYANAAAHGYYDLSPAQTHHSTHSQQLVSGQPSTVDHFLPTLSSNVPLNRNSDALELMLLQMHMAAAAANNAGLLPNVALNFLPQATFSTLNNQHLQLSQQSNLLPTNALSNQLNNLSQPTFDNDFSTNSSMNFNDANKINFTQEYLTRFLANCEHTNVASNSNETCSSTPYMKPQSHSMNKSYPFKRSLDHSLSNDNMNVLRSMCAEGFVDLGMTPLKKRFKKFSFDKTRNASAIGSQDANIEGAQRTKVEELRKRNGARMSRTNVDCSSSPHRHHPYNHRPPAMEARFLECMAAIALHSDFSVPSSDKRTAERRQNKIQNEDETNVICEDTVSCSNSSSDESADSVKEKFAKFAWPNSAIDDELFEEYENYKDKVDVPKIHAYVVTKAVNELDPDSSADNGCESPSVKSLAVPVPVVNLLLDRILQTMLLET